MSVVVLVLAQARELADRYREEERQRARHEVEAFLARARSDIQQERDQAVGGGLAGPFGFDLIAEVKTFHQPQKNGVEMRVVGPALLVGFPDAGQVSVGQDAQGPAGWLIGQDATDGFGDPIGLEHDQVAEYVIVLKI